MSESWRRVAECRRPVSRLQLTVSADANIEIRSSGGTVVGSVFLSAGGSWHNTDTIPLAWLQSPFSVWLRSPDPNCQCQIQAEYITMDYVQRRYNPSTATVALPIDFATVALPIDVLREERRLMRLAEAQRKKENAKEPKKSTKGITRLEAFKRELEKERKNESEE